MNTFNTIKREWEKISCRITSHTIVLILKESLQDAFEKTSIGTKFRLLLDLKTDELSGFIPHNFLVQFSYSHNFTTFLFRKKKEAIKKKILLTNFTPLYWTF